MDRPKFGEVYEATRDVKASITILYKAPASDAFEGVIPAGTRVVILNNPPSRATAVDCAPVNFKELEKLVVPEDQRRDPLYHVYGFTIEIDDLERYFSKEDNVMIRFDDDRMQSIWDRTVKAQKNPIVQNWLKEFQ